MKLLRKEGFTSDFCTGERPFAPTDSRLLTPAILCDAGGESILIDSQNWLICFLAF
jgi:hypothetical protein